MSIGKQIEKARLAKGLKQFNLVSLTGLSFDTIRRYEKDKAKRPSDHALRAFEKALDIKFEK